MTDRMQNMGRAIVERQIVLNRLDKLLDRIYEMASNWTAPELALLAIREAIRAERDAAP